MYIDWKMKLLLRYPSTKQEIIGTPPPLKKWTLQLHLLAYCTVQQTFSNLSYLTRKYSWLRANSWKSVLQKDDNVLAKGDFHKWLVNKYKKVK